MKRLVLAGLFALALAVPAGNTIAQIDPYGLGRVRGYPNLGISRKMLDAFGGLVYSYYTGTPVPQDHAEAVKLNRKAAEQVHFWYLILLFTAIENGKGWAKVDPALVEWVRESAQRGDPGAWYFLAVAYPKDGIGFEDDAEAFRWSRRAAEQGKAGAQFLLASLYGDGKGAPRDIVKSHLWYSLAEAQIARIAAKNGNGILDDDIKTLDDGIKKLFEETTDYIEATIVKVALEMTPAQVAVAQRLAREWMAKHSE